MLISAQAITSFLLSATSDNMQCASRYLIGGKDNE